MRSTASRFAASAGEFVALVGPSGCGKSTLVKLVSGLIPPSGGAIRVNGEPVPARPPSIGIVFQSPVLMAWRTTLRNILLQIEIRGLDVANYRATARELIDLVGLTGSKTPTRTSCPAECSSASACAARSSTIPTCC